MSEADNKIPISYNDLECAYQSAMLGKDEPDEAFFNCPECRRSFHLVVGQENEVCEHLSQIVALAQAKHFQFKGL